MDILCLLLFGAGGAFCRDIFRDGKLVLPKFDNGSLYLGFLGGIVIGAFVGYLVDQSPTTAFFSGFAGYQILENILKKSEVK
jgi:fluoride ion exporter CrcB/FEX